MFGDQTPSNIVWWPNMLILKWVAKGLKHVWSNTDQSIDSSRWASVVRMPVSNMFDTRLSKRTRKTSPIKQENKRINLSFWSNVWWPSNFIKHDQTQLNTIKQHQSKQYLLVFGRQTVSVCPGPKTKLIGLNFGKKDFGLIGYTLPGWVLVLAYFFQNVYKKVLLLLVRNSSFAYHCYTTNTEKFCFGTFQVFSGNTDSSSVVFNKLNATRPIQYVRFYPISFNEQPCMQASVFGCSAGE